MVRGANHVTITALILVFLLTTFLLVYPYTVYPFLLLLLALLFGEERSDAEYRPSVALVIAAYNEEEIIADKIENSFELEYPDDKLEIVVFSDASSDATDEIVRQYSDRGVRLERIEGRVGKTECQNRVVELLDAEVVVFSDANSMYEPDAIYRLVSKFTDGVGCVVGELRLSAQGDDVEGESVYWHSQRILKRLQSKTGSVVKGNGAIYAVRRDDYVPLPSDAISDFAEPLAIRSEDKQVKYAPDAIAQERPEDSVKTEQSRKIRIVVRSWNSLTSYTELANPLSYGLYSVHFVSTTLLWWLSPVFLLGSMVSTVLLAALSGHFLFQLGALGYAGLFLFAAVGYALETRTESSPLPFHISYYFLIGNYSVLAGTLKYLRGERIVTWETTERTK